MRYFLFASIPFAIVLLVAGLVLIAWRRLRGRRIAGSRSWRRTAVYLVLCWMLWTLACVPIGLGYWVSRHIQTRHSERGYDGPRFDAAGAWLVGAHEGGRALAPARFRAADGVQLRAFVVEPDAAAGPPVATWIVVHGLFRSVYEIEPVAAMLRELGCRVLMLELRNHGGSGRAPATLGRDESLDVEAAATWLRRMYGVDRIALFGVSIGTAAICLALDDVKPIAGLVLDAPIVELRATAERSLAESRRLSFPGVAQNVMFGAMEFWSGFDIDAVRTAPMLAALDPQVPVLVIGGGDDHRAPIEEVQGLYDALPTAPDRRSLWIRPGSGHGRVWSDDPAGYRARLARVVEHMRSGR